MVSQHFEQTHTYDCPRCHCATSVKRVASIHENPSNRHDFRFAPPVQHVEPSFLFWPITWGVVIETLTLIAVILLCASDHFSAGAYWLALVGICLPLILSAYAFRRMLKAERHSHTQFEWDEAYVRWKQLFYCTVEFLSSSVSSTFG